MNSKCIKGVFLFPCRKFVKFIGLVTICMGICFFGDSCFINYLGKALALEGKETVLNVLETPLDDDPYIKKFKEEKIEMKTESVEPVDDVLDLQRTEEVDSQEYDLKEVDEDFKSNDDVDDYNEYETEYETEYEEVEFFLTGFIENQNIINSYKEQGFNDAWIKNEIRNKVEIKYGKEFVYLFMINNVYFNIDNSEPNFNKKYEYSEDTQLSRNLRLSGSDFEINFNEFYINYQTEKFRIRAGNQIYGWGTADVINPTSYFNPVDFREFVFKDEDEMKFGVPSVSGMFFGDEYTVELVFVPVHIPLDIAPDSSFWTLEDDDALYSVLIENFDGLPVKVKNFGFGFRVSSNFNGTDISFSGYHGPDKEPVHTPVAMFVKANEPIYVKVEPEYHIIDMVGLDFSKTLGSFVVQFEAVFSPNKKGLVRQNLLDAKNIKFPFEVGESAYLSYAAGFNYFIPVTILFPEHEGDAVFTVEWSQLKYFNDNLYPPTFSDIFTWRFEDSFYNSQIKIYLTGMTDINNSGFLFWPKLEYDFLNGFSIELSYASISGKHEDENELVSLFYYYKDNDIVLWEIKYEY